MHIEKLVLDNFKCFGHEELRVAKITLLLGANSTGKSSLLHGVLGALQSDQFPISFSANGALVNLGDFLSISHGHHLDQDFGISLRFGGHALSPLTLSGKFGYAHETRMPKVRSAEVIDPGIAIKVSKGEKFNAEWTYD